MNNILSAGAGNSPDNVMVAQHALLNSVAMEGPALIVMLRAADLKVLFVNRQFEHYLGYTNADLEGTGIFFTDLLAHYMHDRLTFQLSMVKEDRQARSRYVIYKLTGKDKEQAPFYIYAAPVTDDTGVELYYLTMHPDHSKWDLPFTSFTTRELFLEQFNSENFGTFEWLMDVDKVFWSVGIYRIYDVVDNSYKINKSFVERFTHPDDKERVQREMAIAMDTDTDLSIEYRIITAANQVKIIHALARVIKNHEGRKVKLAGSVRDVTEQRHIEEDLKNKVAELNHSNKDLEEFAYIASHDMQEPLRKITTFSDRLVEKYKDILTGDGLMYLSRMTASAENMRSLINDLLEFSRISESGQPFEQVDLNATLQQVTTDLELTIEETGTVIHSERLPVAEAIPSQMKQLFANIISNAIKFHKADVAPVITIITTVLTEEERLRHELQKGTPYYQVAITDNGIGFEDEYTTRIFQVFQRLHGKSEYPGSGIGLAICKKILEYHHGVIYAESLAGAGARFVFILPQRQPILKEM